MISPGEEARNNVVLGKTQSRGRCAVACGGIGTVTTQEKAGW